MKTERDKEREEAKIRKRQGRRRRSLVWKCDTCGHVEEVDPADRGVYLLGDSEPCLNCTTGTAAVENPS